MKRKFVADNGKRHLRLIKSNDAAEKLYKNYDQLKEHTIPYKQLFIMAGIAYPPKLKQQQGHVVDLINESFNKTKTKAWLFVVKNIGADIKANGDEVYELCKRRKIKELNALKLSKKRYLGRSQCHNGKPFKFLERQIKTIELELQHMSSYIEMEGLFSSEERDKILPE